MTTERRTIYIVTRGEYSSYQVVCAFEGEDDARAAVAAGVGDDYSELPLLPAGNIPRKVSVHHASVRRDGVITASSSRDEWDFSESAAPVREWGTPHTDVYISGTDKGRVEKAAHDRAARLRAEQEGLTSP